MAMMHFFNCHHGVEQLNETTEVPKIYTDCASDLESASRKVDDTIASASRLSSSLAAAVLFSSEGNIRGLALAVSEVMKAAIRARKTFFTFFEEKRSSDVHQYEAQYSNVPNNDPVCDMYWLDDAQITAKYFLDGQSSSAYQLRRQ